MCFSAPASFIASGGLALLGGSSLAAARKEDRLVAAVPLLFALQQGIEGIQWMYLNAGSSSLAAGYGFLFFALILWPAYVPALVFFTDKSRRSSLKWLMILGITVSICLLAILLRNTLSIRIIGSCVRYGFEIPFKVPLLAAYLTAVFLPLFLSGKRFFRQFGIAMAFFALVAALFYTQAFISVWCFFAAITSALLFGYVIRKRDRRRQEKKNPA